MRKFLKISISAVIVIFVLAAVCALVIFLKYRSIKDENIAPKFVKSEILPSDEAPLGDVLQAVFTIKSPWDKYPLAAEVKPSNGSQIAGKVKFEKIKKSWGYTIWKVIIPVQAYITGIIPEGDAAITFSPDKDGNKSVLSLKIPEITSLEITHISDKPLLASREEIKPLVKSKTFYYICGITLLIIVCLILWLIFRKRKEKPRILMPWEKAILALNEIKIDFSKGKLSPINCFLRLTDTVRFYLEERFYIHAPKQTTEEFMSDMENTSSPLNNNDRNFLREFMRSGDMIKFAKYEADASMIGNSIERALLLITETIPAQNETSNTEQGKN